MAATQKTRKDSKPATATAKAPAKAPKATAKAAESEKPKRAAKGEGTGPRWSLGLFRNKRGKLSSVYVTKDGVPMPYEQPRVGGAKILFHRTYTGVTFAEARQKLLKDAKKEKGLVDELVEAPAKAAPKASTKGNGKATKAAAAPRKRRAAAATAETESEGGSEGGEEQTESQPAEG